MKKFLFAILALIFLGAVSSASALDQVEELGKRLYFDKNLSEPFGLACAGCHWPAAGFADPNRGFPVSEGVIKGMFGGRNAPSAAYMKDCPILNKDSGTWIGGAFWDGRATGSFSGHPLSDQALGPFINPVEMNNPPLDYDDPDYPDYSETVVDDVISAWYSNLYISVFGDFDDDYPNAYYNIGDAIGAFEQTGEFHRFNSRFDDFWRACVNAGIDDPSALSDVNAAPKGILSGQEIEGFILFKKPLGEGGANCSACHTLDNPSQNPNNTEESLPIFTDFSYDNLGIPHNYDVDALTGNEAACDPGLANTVSDGGECGKFKVPTLRNIAKTMPYGHNGYFKTLEEIVHFYNTRDVPGEGWKNKPWPESECEAALNGTIAPCGDINCDCFGTINRAEMGDLGLTHLEELQIVQFLRTLSDR